MAEPIEFSSYKDRFAQIRTEQVSGTKAPLSSGGGGGTSGIMTLEERVHKLENASAKIDGQLDFAKIVLATLLAAVLGGFGLLLSVTLNGNSRIEGKVEGITSKINDEFRSQRADQSATISAISNAITAAKQQTPQVLLVPAPVPSATAKQP